jgi:2-C-methyl-D-erythritol 4-phosphate cytidylyltransferase/2-C-methyl-D-erythritol 2,4-cyclodiphosphate synthase
VREGPAGAVVVAAGEGVRLGGPVPKPFLPLDGASVLDHALAAFVACPRIGPIVVVVAAGAIHEVRSRLADRVAAVVAGGPTRRASVAAGLAALEGVDWVVVHDGVRPFVTTDLIERVLDAAAATGAATPGLALTDTVKAVAGEWVRQTVDRRGLVAVQTPQAFRAALLRRAHAEVPSDAPVTDDAGLVEWLGVPVRVVPGDPANLKITTQADYALARRYAGRDPGEFRVGVGTDAHRLTPDRPLVLGGVRIPHPRGLEGHSDADVLTHAIIDALLGAAALPDIGRQFPPDDPAYRGADSLGLLARVAGQLGAAGWTVVNVDAVVCAHAPRLAPYVEAMRDRLAETLGIAPGCVGIKATTWEGLDAAGRGEGITAQAVALLRRRG